MKENFFSYLDLCINEDKLPHAFLLETNNITLFMEKLVAYLYENQLIKNSDFGNNLNTFLVEPDGKEIKAADITNLLARFATMPINDKYNIYLIVNAEKMNGSATNKLLKFLEESPANTIGFLVSVIDNNILPTIKSRCQTFKYECEFLETDMTEYLSLVQDFMACPSFEKERELRNLLIALERSEIIVVMQNLIFELERQLINPKKEVDLLAANILLLDKILHLLRSNVNIELVLDKLSLEVR